jgi:hypothetical protein
VSVVTDNRKGRFQPFRANWAFFLRLQLDVSTGRGGHTRDYPFCPTRLKIRRRTVSSVANVPAAKTLEFSGVFALFASATYRDVVVRDQEVTGSTPISPDSSVTDQCQRHIANRRG